MQERQISGEVLGDEFFFCLAWLFKLKGLILINNIEGDISRVIPQNIESVNVLKVAFIY